MEDKPGIVDYWIKDSLTWVLRIHKLDGYEIFNESEKISILSQICQDAISNLQSKEDVIRDRLIKNDLIQVKIDFSDDTSNFKVKFEVEYSNHILNDNFAIRDAQNVFKLFIKNVKYCINLHNFSSLWEIFEEITTKVRFEKFLKKCKLLKTYNKILKELENWFYEGQNYEKSKEFIKKLELIEEQCEILGIYNIQSDKNKIEEPRFFASLLDKELAEIEANINYSYQNKSHAIKSIMRFLSRMSSFSESLLESALTIELKILIENSLKNLLIKTISTTDSVYVYISDYKNLLNQNATNIEEIKSLNLKLISVSSNLDSAQNELNKKIQELNQITQNLNEQINENICLSRKLNEEQTNFKLEKDFCHQKLSNCKIELLNSQRELNYSHQELNNCNIELLNSQTKLNDSQKLLEALKQKIHLINDEYVIPFGKMVEAKKIIEKNNTSLALHLDNSSKALKETQIQKLEIEKKLNIEIQQLKKSNDFLSQQLQNSKHSVDIQEFKSQLSELNKVRNKLIEKTRENKLLVHEKSSLYPDYELLKELAIRLQKENIELQSQLNSRYFIDNLIKSNK